MGRQDFSLQKKRISIDFDGVILSLMRKKPVLDRQAKKYQLNFLNQLYSLMIETQQRFKKPIDNSFEIITWLKQTQQATLFLNTSRRPTLEGVTSRWLRNNNYLPLFEQLFFNSQYQSSPQSKLHNIQKYNLDIHIDDIPTVIETLSKELPNKQFIFLNPGTYQEIRADNVINISNWRNLQNFLD